MNRILMLAFACLASFKFLAVMSEGSEPLAATVFMLMFGSPQLLWVALCFKWMDRPSETRTGAWVAAAFVGTSVFFGSFPGTGTPSWAGEGHFEVPAAFLIEWLVSVVGVAVLFTRRRRRDA